MALWITIPLFLNPDLFFPRLSVTVAFVLIQVLLLFHQHWIIHPEKSISISIQDETRTIDFRWTFLKKYFRILNKKSPQAQLQPYEKNSFYGETDFLETYRGQGLYNLCEELDYFSTRYRKEGCQLSELPSIKTCQNRRGRSLFEKDKLKVW